MAQLIKRGVNTWQVRIYLGKDFKTGKRQFHTHTIHGTKKEAQLYIGEYETNHARGYTAQRKLTFFSAWERYITDCKIKLNPNTIYLKQRIFSAYLESFASLPLCELSNFDIQELINLLAETKQNSSVKTIYATIKAFFNQCILWGLILKSPCEGVIIPKVSYKLNKIQPLDLEEISRFMAACRNNRHGLFMRMQLLTGCRTSELRALCWDCVNFSESTITIKRGVNQKTQEIQELTKNDTSNRVIQLDNITILSLKKAKLASQSELVFPGSKKGKVINTHVLLNSLNKILNEAGIKRDRFRLYDLRHSCATYLLNMGVPVRAVSDRLGHASSKMTLDVYSHYTSDLNGPLYSALSKIDEEAEKLVNNQ